MLKTVELSFVCIKQNIQLTEFRTFELKQVNIEFKLFRTQFHRIFNEINRKNNKDKIN